MLVTSKVFDALKNIGLNLYERKLWVALLARGTATAGELSQIAGVPRSRTYDVLEKLAEKGFVVVQNSKPISFVAISPPEALDRAKKKLEEDFVEMQERTDELKKSPILKELNDVFSKGLKLISPEEMTGSLRGKDSLHQQLSTMFKNANKHISILTTPDGLSELAENHLEILKKATNRGVDVKIATTFSGKYSDVAKSFGNIADVRRINEKEIPIFGRFFIVDGKELVFSLTDSNVHATQDMSIWSKSEHAASDMLGPLFNMIWKNSKNV